MKKLLLSFLLINTIITPCSDPNFCDDYVRSNCAMIGTALTIMGAAGMTAILASGELIQLSEYAIVAWIVMGSGMLCCLYGMDTIRAKQAERERERQWGEPEQVRRRFELKERWERERQQRELDRMSTQQQPSITAPATV